MCVASRRGGGKERGDISRREREREKTHTPLYICHKPVGANHLLLLINPTRHKSLDQSNNSFLPTLNMTIIIVSRNMKENDTPIPLLHLRLRKTRIENKLAEIPSCIV